jgi:hypothetical protein
MLRRALRQHVPEAHVPAASYERQYVRELCATLIYERTRRPMLWQRWDEQYAAAKSTLAQHYAECARRGEPVDVRDALTVLNERMARSYDELRQIGPFDEAVDVAVLDYFIVCVSSVWKLMHGTPFATRSPIPLRKVAASILYMLRDGFHVTVTYDGATGIVVGKGGGGETTTRVTFIPPHAFLDRMLLINDMNHIKWPAPFDKWLCSKRVVAGQREVMQCFGSLLTPPTPIATVRAFELARYIKLSYTQ